MIEDMTIEEWLNSEKVRKIFNIFKAKYCKSIPRDEIESIGNFTLSKCFTSFRPGSQKKPCFAKYFMMAFRNNLNTEYNQNMKQHDIVERCHKRHSNKTPTNYTFSPYPFLSDKENSVVFKKFWESKSLKEIGLDLGVSFQYIAIILQSAFEKIRKSQTEGGVSNIGRKDCQFN